MSQSHAGMPVLFLCRDNALLSPMAEALLNTRGGGNSRNVRRPNLIPGVDPYLKNGNQWLNPAAFSTPAAGEFATWSAGPSAGRASGSSTSSS